MFACVKGDFVLYLSYSRVLRSVTVQFIYDKPFGLLERRGLDRDTATLQAQFLVDETFQKLRQGEKASDIKLDKSIKVLRDRSVEWLVKGYEAINDAEFIQKVRQVLLMTAGIIVLIEGQAWEMCSVGEFNMSYKSLSSSAIRHELNRVAQSPFYSEITSGRSQNAPQSSDEPDGQYEEDILPIDDDAYDDTSVSTRRVKKRTVRKATRKTGKGKKPRTTKAAAAKPPIVQGHSREDDELNSVPGYAGFALIDGKVTLAVPTIAKTRMSTRTRFKVERYADPLWIDNDVTTSECEEMDSDSD